MKVRQRNRRNRIRAFQRFNMIKRTLGDEGGLWIVIKKEWKDDA